LASSFCCDDANAIADDGGHDRVDSSECFVPAITDYAILAHVRAALEPIDHGTFGMRASWMAG
jgi:hypothetical protein